MSKTYCWVKWMLALAMSFPLIVQGATTYTVDIDTNNSSVTVDGSDTYSIFGTFTLTVENSNWHCNLKRKSVNQGKHFCIQAMAFQ